MQCFCYSNIAVYNAVVAVAVAFFYYSFSNFAPVCLFHLYLFVSPDTISSRWGFFVIHCTLFCVLSMFIALFSFALVSRSIFAWTSWCHFYSCFFISFCPASHHRPLNKVQTFLVLRVVQFGCFFALCSSFAHPYVISFHCVTFRE